MRVEILGLNSLFFFFFCLFFEKTEANAAACLAAVTPAACTAVACSGVWDNTNSVCVDCQLNSTNCNNTCLQRWISPLTSCVLKCTNANDVTTCGTCYGYWNAGSNVCYDCMQDQSTCQDVCGRFWINGYCWDCNGSIGNCTNAATCNGTWNAGTCSVCWPNQTYCNGCNSFWGTDSGLGIVTTQCINCQANQATCESPTGCNGYWNSGTSTCTVCSLNATSCTSAVCNGSWNSATNTCSNCSNDQRQCTLCDNGTNTLYYLFGQCVNCTGYNSCTNINYCNGEWNGTTSVCTVCNQNSATCTTAGANNCNGTWVTNAGVSSCNRCQENQTQCTKCQMNWIPGTLTCLNCSSSSAVCTNTAVCNGVWNSATSSCLVCNLDSGTCSSCPGLRNWDPRALPAYTNTCLNCFNDATTCGNCSYFWVPSNSYYDNTIQGTCVNCNSSQNMCTNKSMCNGIWNINTSVCSDQCNVNSATCTNANCKGQWDNVNKLCNVCGKTQAECNICGLQWVIGTCKDCQLNSATCIASPCSGLWTATNAVGSQCLVCNQNSTNCKSCGGFWINSRCLQCDSNSATCTQCGGIYSNTTSTCTLLNDQYTCKNIMTSSMGEAYWNGIQCVDCQSSQYICNKECFRVWTNEACSTQSCDTDQYTCESLCFLHWNYYQSKCYFDDINLNSICTISNDSVMLNGSCIQCHVSQDLCVNQCNQAYSPNGLRTWVNSQCTDCQSSQNTCVNVCKMNWVPIVVSGQTTTYVCILCNSDSYNCSICQGTWDSVNLICNQVSTFCNTNAANCSNCSFLPTLQFNYATTSSQCYYCSANQYTCETACNSLWMPRLQYCEVMTTVDLCQLNNRGVWDTVNKVCILCNTSSTNCTKCNANNVWDATNSVCLNINQGQAYCNQVSGSSGYVWITDTLSTTYGISLVNGRCISCNTNSNVCTNACKRSWSGATCLLCNSSQAICQTNCGLNWIAGTPNICTNCNQNSATCLGVCNWYWNSSTSSCLNCNSNLATCQNPSTCNGNWNSGLGVCNFCNASQSNCVNLCYFIWSQQTASCVNCQSSQAICEQQCQYVWNPTLASNNCVLCNQNQATCVATGTYNCNGFWLATNTCTQFKCNQDSNTCINKCLMNWNSLLNLCQKCTQTQYQNGSGTCIECNTMTTSGTCVTNCQTNQFFWDTTIATTYKCRQCYSTEYWNGTSCVVCTSIDPNCNSCQKVSGTATCLGCSNNFRVSSATVCSCNSDRIPNSSGVCTLCSTLIANCANCSVLGTCDTCNSGYSWDSTNKVCRAKFTFTSNTLSGIAFVTDFTFTLSYPNANNPTNKPIVYAVYLYDSITAYNNELTNFLNQQITVGVLYQSGLSQNIGYTVKLKSGNPVLAPLLILNGQVIPPQDQILVFSITAQFTYLDQFTKYINSITGLLTPKDFYYKQYTDELVNQYCAKACSNCPTGVTCITNSYQCNCSSYSSSVTLYDCSGLDNTQFDSLATNLFSYFMGSSTDPQSLGKLMELLKHVDTLGNSNMNVALFQKYTSLIPQYVASKAPPSAYDQNDFIDIIKKVVTYVDYLMGNSLATTSSQIYTPHDNIQTAIISVLDSQSTYTLETLSNARLSAAALSSMSSLITTIDMYKLQYATVKPLIYQASSNLAVGGAVKAARFFYATDPFYINNSTYTSYNNYPYVEYYVYQQSGTTYTRQNVQFTFIYTLTDISQSIKCAQRQGIYLQLCNSTTIDNVALTVTCSCSNSVTLIEKTILVEPTVVTESNNNNVLYIILGCSLGGSLVIFLGFLFVYLKKQALNDRFKILKKQKDGSRAIDPNLSLDDYDLGINE